MATPILTSTTDKSSITEPLITGEEFAAMDIGRAELVEGKVIEMTPPQTAHGRCESKFTYALMKFALENKAGIVVSGEAGIYTRRNPDSVRGMDVAFISNARWAQQKNKDKYLEIAPELIVEVLSPDDRWKDVTQKLREYFNIGVQVVWVADPAARTVFAYRSLTEVREYTEKDALTGDEVLPGFSVPVASFFEE